MADQKTILFVEDEPDILDMYRQAFTMSGVFKMLGAENGTEGLKVAAEHHSEIDMILLDMKLRDIDGLEVLKKLKSDPATKDIPVIMFSNAYQKDYEQKGLDLGAERFIQKTMVLPLEMVDILKKRLGVK